MTNSTNKEHNTLIQIFTRTPVAGAVKKRLIPELGSDRSCELHQRMTLHTLKVATNMSSNLEIWVTPDINHIFFTTLISNNHLKPQIGESLVERMAFSLNKGLENHKKVLLIGCDCPSINKAMLKRAFLELDRHEYVFIPVEDGGFSLVGTHTFSPAIFHNVPWGTNQVMHQIRSNLKTHSRTWQELPILWDVDEIADYHRLTEYMPQLTHGL
ncbi:MAG: TIGR04282 family arsenosugar biosynthesis glycosyltransferase [Proteobacteria bacterium]|nr:TIGR04282 family arsenosugar biosynthesis glycosyltransferase [Pseudomonadota bacterium]MDA1330885.1 TIGR04282 family arsenosugar biosynthesis glycosyltransferase [Pseudomonadota bacterium]